MRKKSRLLLWMLAVFVMLSAVMAGCGSGGSAAKPATQQKPVSAPQSAERDFVTVHALTPAEWESVSLWAWKYGGEDVFDAWPGQLMGNGEYCYEATVPAWVDRVIINGNDGTIQTADLEVDAGKDVWVYVSSADEAIVSYEEPDFWEESFVTVYALAPAEWESVSIWAWKEGGEDVFDAWPGQLMGNGEYCYKATVPAWVDRVIINGNDGTIQTADLEVDAGKDVWVYVFSADEAIVSYEEPDFREETESVESNPFLDAARREDFETMKQLLPTIEDRSILTDWEYNDFNYAYASEAILAGEYETAIEFFGYCSYEDHRLYSTIFRQLLDGDVEGAMDTRSSMGFTTLDIDLDMSWNEIIRKVTGAVEDPSDLNYILMDKYLTRRMWVNQPKFTEDSLVFGDYSAWESRNYIGETMDPEYYPPVANLKTLTAQCGSEANGKVLILRSQKSYPQGSTYYAVDLSTMEYLSYDLYPASLSEVEYIIEVNYDYANEGRYKQTFSMGDNSVVDYFDFLRMKGQVQLKEVLTGKTLQQSQWIMGTGDVEAHFSDESYQCSNMPETGVHIISAVGKVRELNAAQ